MTEISEIVFGQQELGEILGRVTDLAMVALAGCNGASLRLRMEDTTPLIVGSHGLAISMECLQDELSEGPCIACLEGQTAQSIAYVGQDHQWRQFAARAFAEGLGSCLAVPLGVLGTFEGAFNFYWISPQIFSDAQWRVATLITNEAAPTVANAVEMSIVTTEVARLSLELEGDDDHLVALAVGILQTRYRLSNADARRQLQANADTGSVTLQDVARQLVETIQSAPRP